MGIVCGPLTGAVPRSLVAVTLKLKVALPVVRSLVSVATVFKLSAVGLLVTVTGVGVEQVGGGGVPPETAQVKVTRPVKPFSGMTMIIARDVPPAA